MPHALSSDPPATPPLRLSKAGVVMLPHTTIDDDGREAMITGLSGITWLGDDRYAAIMDNSDRVLLFSLPIAPDGIPGEPADLELITLSEKHDYEDIAPCPEALEKRIAGKRIRQGFVDPGRCALVCEEDTPAIRAISLIDGSLLGVIPTPKIFATRRPNRGFESIDVEPDGRHIWSANEEALPADGPAASASAGTVVRLTRIAIPEQTPQVTPQQPIQLAYAVDPPHEFVRVFSGEPLSGVSALMGLGDGTLLVLERSGCPGLPPFENRIYLVDPRSATDVTDVEKDLAMQPDRFMKKTLLWKEQLGCNVEGLCLGPSTTPQSRLLLGIADNGGIGTPNQIVTFLLEEPANESSLVPFVIGGCAIAMAVLGLLLYRLTR